MRFFNWLFAHTPKPSDPPPEILISVTTSGREERRAFVPDDAAIKASDDATQDAEVNASTSTLNISDEALMAAADLGDAYCLLQYTDSRGAATERRISMRSLKRATDAIYLNAFCFERRAMRQFRLDRIRAIIDEDGEVHTAQSFFGDVLGVTLRQQTAQEAATARTSAAMLAALRPGLAILTAAARADKKVHLSEINALEIYAEREVLHLIRSGALQLDPHMEAIAAMGKSIALMRPMLPTIRNHVNAICDWPEDRFRRLNRALGETIIADGKVVQSERDFVDELNAFAAKSITERQRDLAGWNAKFSSVDEWGN